MFNVTLINLAADARSAVVDAPRTEFRGIRDDRMRELLGNFCEIDAVENATADPELRVQTQAQSFLIHTAGKKLILHDVLNRDAASQLLTVDELMAELDGSASAARILSYTAQPWATRAAEEPIAPPVVRRNVPRLISLAAMAALLIASVVYVRQSFAGDGDSRAGFVRAANQEALRASLAGVYLTGTQPGDHGISYFATGELRLFQFRGADAPGLIYAKAELGQIGSLVCLATDQPGGVITVLSDDSLGFCGETYKRVR
jgi:hypothetical protein